MTAVVVAVDGSEASAAALALAVAQAREQNRPLAGVFVIDAGWADFIGNDWQSAAGARQGFLDYVRADQEKQAAAARRQFESVAAEVTERRFEVLVGDPAEALIERMAAADAGSLVLGRNTFAVCGRPSINRLAKRLTATIGRPVTIV